MSKAAGTFNNFRNFGTSPEGGSAEPDSSVGAQGSFPRDPSDFRPNLLTSHRQFAIFSWCVLIYNLLAVAFGVLVRAGKFGDGGGKSWPLLDPNHAPMNGDLARLIEGSHRLSTALIGVMALAMVVGARRLFEKGHPVRRFSSLVMAFTVLEGLVGAALVKFELVTTNDSPQRALVMMFHVISTYLLVGFIAAAALSASGIRPMRWRGQGVLQPLLGIGFGGLILLGMSGAVSALAHQLRPTENVLKAAMLPDTFWMVKLQPTHPLMSVTVALYLVLAAGLIQHLRPDPNVRKASRWLTIAIGAQCVLGLVNIWLKAPVPMQMAHLVLADLNWISLVALALVALGENIEPVEERPAPQSALPAEPLRGRGLVKAYLALTKPRVISLLLFTTLMSMIAAKGEWPGTFLFLVVGIAGYMVAGAANTINMVIDRDIDFNMKRTSSRPTVTQAISSSHALIFAFALAAISFTLLSVFATLLSAVMALSGLVFYVVVYTMLLKRRTWHNIVIGGAAGAFPPLVGWSAVTGDLPPLALYLFAIIFVWTPVHFWALALLIKDDYAAAGVPMLPVVKGDKATVNQIGYYTAVTVACTFAPLFLPQVGWIYGGVALVLNILLVMGFVKLWKQIDRPTASGLFHFSMLYLALLFVGFAVDRVVVIG